MASNSFGNIFRITTWGESHGKAMGVVIDGCPAGIKLETKDINLALSKRAPGQTPYTSPRLELDLADIYSGVFEGLTTGAPISIIIENRNADSSKYEPIKHLLRPGHANYTYIKKYGVFDYRGGGRASARETICRVAAGAVAQKILDNFGIKVSAYIRSIGKASVTINTEIDEKVMANSPIFAPNKASEAIMLKTLENAMINGDSLGGVVEFFIENMLIGLGDPIYEKLEANLAKAMLSLPASKGFEIGEGFNASLMQGSEHNDTFSNIDSLPTETNHAGGVLGGISSGMPICGRVAFKPTSSIKQPMNTIDLQGQKSVLNLPEGSKHDPCVAIRAVPIVAAMCQLVIADAILLNRCIREL